jgi:hypothetical protein
MVSAIMSSCNRSTIFEYAEDKEAYINIVQCLRENYLKIYTPLDTEGSINFAPISESEHGLCANMFVVLQRHNIEYVKFERDSTVSFYSHPHGLKDEQFILIFVPHGVNIKNKLTGEMKILNKMDEKCYELED